MIETLKQNPTWKFEMSAHTDNQGSSACNMQLSQQRANAIKNYLLSNNIAPDRLTMLAFGDTQPLKPNDTEKNRESNKRVEYRFWVESK